MMLKLFRNSLIGLFAQIAYHFAAILPRSFGLKLFGAIGKFVFIFPNIEKQRTIDHLTLIYGKEWSRDRILSTARSVYCSLGKNMFDSIQLSRSPDDRFKIFVKHDDLAEFRNVHEQGKGVIVTTAHIGCFDLLLHFCARNGFPCFAVGRKSFDPRIDRIIHSIRSGKDIDYIDRSESARHILRFLQKGKVFGVLVDQDTQVESIFAPFLGRTAATPSAPFRMALRFKIPLVVMTTARQPDSTHHVYISKPLALPDTGDFHKDLTGLAAAANGLIGETISRFPEQWVWMHRRWKNQPPQKSITR